MAFFERFSESIKRADAYHIVRDNARKVYENTIRNSKRNDSDGEGKGNKKWKTCNEKVACFYFVFI